MKISKKLQEVCDAANLNGHDEIWTDGYNAQYTSVHKLNGQTSYGEPVENIHIFINDGVSPVLDILLTPEVVAQIKKIKL